MKIAQIIDGAIALYPYPLRPDAKRAHPEVSPLPGTWEQCTPEQIAALGAVVVVEVSAPELQPGERLEEGTPELVEGEWRQTWVVSPAPPPPSSVPDSVPAHHLRRALRASAMLDGVNAYMAALPDDDEMRESWEYAPFFRRDAIGIEAARVALGLTHAQVDALFTAAGNVQT